ncbi:hypothetical protein BHM03_00009702 [Ensete ventricosum]|uniref:Small acidic protein-like domain-containing protein n=1 Tax=Ensete ventricosum TaxID=4639 RepID=A0A427A1E8_ENSVE|nr:hypothetical protein B296_00003350 [Ensete ventricosum]RZR83146.1 hypothetical protein BHM03_00009702 [Ensete ventricosum]
MEVHTRTSDDQRKKDAGRESERDSGSVRSSRGHDSRKHSERHSHENSHDYRRHDNYSRHRRHVDENNRNYQMSSRAGLESRDYRHSDYTESERMSNKNRDNRRNVDNHSKDKTDISDHKNKNKEREPDKDYDREISAPPLKESKKSNKKDFHEHGPNDKDGSLQQAKKQEELDTDLEKQYTSGHRRRDGRTFGLGL